jgi:hypothetical protein
MKLFYYLLTYRVWSLDYDRTLYFYMENDCLSFSLNCEFIGVEIKETFLKKEKYLEGN